MGDLDMKPWIWWALGLGTAGTGAYFLLKTQPQAQPQPPTTPPTTPLITPPATPLITPPTSQVQQPQPQPQPQQPQQAQVQLQQPVGKSLSALGMVFVGHRVAEFAIGDKERYDYTSPRVNKLIIRTVPNSWLAIELEHYKGIDKYLEGTRDGYMMDITKIEYPTGDSEYVRPGEARSWIYTRFPTGTKITMDFYSSVVDFYRPDGSGYRHPVPARVPSSDRNYVLPLLKKREIKLEIP